MSPPKTRNLFSVLVYRANWHCYATFRTQYDRAASRVDRTLVGTWPSRSQFHRWLAGQLVGLPYPDHCRVLECMFPDWTATDLFAPCPAEVLDAETDTATSSRDLAARSGAPEAGRGPLADLSGVFTSRSEFASAVPPHVLFAGARHLRAVGLSLNMLCQHYPDHHLRQLVEDGAQVQLLFLDPEGAAMKLREREEGYPVGQLAALTALNLHIVMQRVRDRLSSEAQDRLHVAVYDETLRFNITIADDTCVVQPYLPAARGVDSPTLVLRRGLGTTGGLFPVFEQVFTTLAERSTQLCR